MRRSHWLFLSVSAMVVAVLWAMCLKWGLQLQTQGTADKISAYGQFGDLFGSVNALFTGFALIGLIYTALQQRDQLVSQSREQFLAARLNATSALLHACEVRNATHTGSDAFREHERRQIAGLLQDIDILRCEAELEITYSPWSPRVEVAALHRYLTNLLTDFGQQVPHTGRWPDPEVLPGD